MLETWRGRGLGLGAQTWDSVAPTPQIHTSTHTQEYSPSRLSWRSKTKSVVKEPETARQGDKGTVCTLRGEKTDCRPIAGFRSREGRVRLRVRVE